jgi:hypothetical protein
LISNISRLKKIKALESELWSQIFTIL